MSRVLIVGAAGMIGAKLTVRLLAAPRLGGAAVDEVMLADVVAPTAAVAAPF